MYVSGLGKVDYPPGSAWCSSGPYACLLQDRSSLLQRQSTSQGNMGDSEPPGILCESCAHSCIIHTNLQSCMSIMI